MINGAKTFSLISFHQRGSLDIVCGMNEKVTISGQY
jgi:hypothetical protein